MIKTILLLLGFMFVAISTLFIFCSIRLASICDNSLDTRR